jgi:hypothetical protein
VGELLLVLIVDLALLASIVWFALLVVGLLG